MYAGDDQFVVSVRLRFSLEYSKKWMETYGPVATGLLPT